MPAMSESDLWSEGLKLVSFCPVCETRTDGMNAQTLGQEGETHLLHIQCFKCQNTFLSLVLVHQIGATSVGLLTDLSYEDVHRFHSDQAISINDVIKTHVLFSRETVL